MYYFIVNAASRTGKAKRIWDNIEEYLKEKQIDYMAFCSKYAGHAKELAKEISSFPESTIKLVVLGGDGTINEVLNGITDFEKIRLGYIPTGSGNDFGRGLGLPKDPLEALNHILSSTEDYVMDIGKVTYGKRSRYFAISSGVGIDADVCKQALHSRLKVILNRLKLGKLTYLLLTLRALRSMPTTEAEIYFEDGTAKKIEKMIFVVGMNERTEGGGIPMAPKADDRDGKLSVCLVYGISRVKAFFLLPFLVLGKHTWFHGFEIVDSKKYTVKLKDAMVLHADGEYCGEVNEMTFACVPKKLHIMNKS